VSIELIEDERDIFQHYDAAMAERAEAVDLAFQDEFVEQPELEAAARRFLASEFVRQGHVRLRDQGVVPEVLPDEGDLNRSLELDVFPDRERESLEQKLRDFVAQTIRDPEGTGDGAGGGERPPRPAPPIKPLVSGSHQFGHMCVQVSSGFPGPKLPPLAARPVPPAGRNFFLLAIILSEFSLGPGYTLQTSATGDAVMCSIEDGLPPNQILVEASSQQVRYATEIIAWNRAEGEIATLHEPGRGPPTPGGPLPAVEGAQMLLTRDCFGADTLCFGRYAGPFNAWVQLSHMDPGTFWTHFGGRRLSFNWRFSP
jgi:hypothetical protein